MTAADRDPCLDHTFPEGLCCGDCSTIDRVYLANNLPHLPPLRALFTVEDIERWTGPEGAVR